MIPKKKLGKSTKKIFYWENSKNILKKKETGGIRKFQEKLVIFEEFYLEKKFLKNFRWLIPKKNKILKKSKN